MMKSIKNMVRKGDMLGRNTLVTFHNESTFRTSGGGLFSLFLISFFLVVGYYYLLMFLSHPNPVIIIQENFYEPKYPKYEVKNYLPLAFRFEDMSGNSIYDRTYIDFEVNYFNCTRDEKYTFICEKTKINFKNCTSNSFTNDLKNLFKPFLNNSFCINLNDYVIDSENNTNLTIEGYWDQNKISYFQISIKKCENNSDILCKNDSEIMNYLNKAVYFSMYNLNYNLMYNDYETPFKGIINNCYFVIEREIGKIFFNNFVKTTLGTDIGPVFTDYDNITVYNNEGFLQDLFYYNETKEINYLSSVEIHTSRLVRYNRRGYVKITTVFANLGGVINICMILCEILFSRIVNLKFYLKLINSFFNFPEELFEKELPKEIKELHDDKFMKHLYLDNNGIDMKEVNFSKKSKKNRNLLYDNIGYRIKLNDNKKDNTTEESLKSADNNNVDLKSIPEENENDNNELNDIVSLQIRKRKFFKYYKHNFLSNNNKKNYRDKCNIVVSNILKPKLKSLEDKQLTGKKVLDFNKQTFSLLNNSLRCYSKKSTNKNESIEKIKFKKLSFSYLEIVIFKYLFCSCLVSNKLASKILIYHDAKNRIKKLIDILSIVDLYQQVEKLKYLFLTPNQISLFNFPSKPIYSYYLKKSTDNNFSKMIMEADDKSKSFSVYRDYKTQVNLGRKSVITELDKKLMNI